ncbi:MAG: TonB family protein [Alphaproteobacteria bacterium]|nr:TonB family protein [Alphaproteobacteria bacterium]
MHIAARAIGLIGSASANAVASWLWQFVPLQPPPIRDCMDCFGGGAVVQETGLFIATRVRAHVGASGGDGFFKLDEHVREPCRIGRDVERDPYLLSIVPRPLVPGRYRRELSFCVEVTANGRVGRVFTVRSSGNAETDRRALRRLRTLRFQPAIRGGRPVASWHRMSTGEPWIEALPLF